MDNDYRELRDRQQEEVNNFPFFFAFSKEQFEKGMEKFGLKHDETDKIYRFGNTGGFYLRIDAEKLRTMISKHESELQAAIGNDSTGEEFILQMFNYELSDHEYIITNSEQDALNALGLSWEEIEKNPALKHGLELAKKMQREYFNNEK